MSLEIYLSFILTFAICFLLVPGVSKISKKLGIIAQTNERTIHKGVIARTGGYAIYISFILGAMIFLKTDQQINAILIGGFIVFVTGLYDDIHDIDPKLKLLGQIISALIIIFYGGISLKGFTIPFLPETLSYIIAIIITLFWIVGITNAVNLIDGLDGLCGGISIIVLITISMTSLASGRTDITSLSLLLAGAIGGFLVYNFHPASIFLGDCGALFIGYMIAVISLLGFGYKTTSFFTLGAPIVVLMVPIMDTFIAIVRRKVHHKSFSEADKGHLHHKLMFSLELGQTKSVLILYAVTILFSICSYIYLFNKVAASILFIILLILFEIFVEATSMIDRKYKPLLTILNVFVKSEYLPSIKDTKPYRKTVKKIKKKSIVISLLIMSFVLASIFFVYKQIEPKNSSNQTITMKYKPIENETELLSNIYNQLETAFQSEKQETIRESVAAYFVTDYFTLSNKEKDLIGGETYFCIDKIDDYRKYAKEQYYKNANEFIENNQNVQEVKSYEIISNEKSMKALDGLEDYDYYDIEIKIHFKEYNTIVESEELNILVTLILKDNIYSVVAFEY